MSGLYLNYCFCSVTDDNADVYSIDYKDKEQLINLRNDKSGICFYRSGKLIYFWGPDSATEVLAKELNATKVNINCKKYPTLISKMIENKIYDLFDKTRSYILYYEKYSHVLVGISRRSALSVSRLTRQMPL